MNKTMMKSMLLLLSVTVLASLLMSGCANDADDNQAGGDGNQPNYRFRLAETHAADYPTTLADIKFAELVQERTNGRIRIDVFPSSQLGQEKAVIEQVQLGAIDFTRVSASPLSEFNKDYGVFSLPYIFNSDEHMWRFLESDTGTRLLESLESSRMRGLAYYSSGARNFYSRRPLTSLADLRGQKIRVQQTRINMDLVSALGASATPMDFGEVYSSLQTGVIDAAENNYPSYYSTKHYEVARHFILDEHQRVPEVLVISKTVWDRLSNEDKQIIQQAAQDSVATQRELWAAFEQESEEKVRAAGAVITPVEDKGPWQAAARPVIDKYRADYQEVLTAIEALQGE